MLDEHPERPRLIAWIRDNGNRADEWKNYLDQLDGGANPDSAQSSDQTGSP